MKEIATPVSEHGTHGANGGTGASTINAPGISQTAGDKLRRLANLASVARQSIYERVGLASDLMADAQYLEARHKGDPAHAADFLEKLYFPELGSALSLHTLVEIYRTFAQSVWEQEEYNLNALRIRLDKSRRSNRRNEREPVPRPTAADITERDERIAELTVAVTKQEQITHSRDEELSRIRAENANLREQNQRLQVENARLAGEINGLKARVVVGPPGS